MFLLQIKSSRFLKLYTSSFNSVARHFQSSKAAFQNTSQKSQNIAIKITYDDGNTPDKPWPNELLGPLNTPCSAYPLPGNIGLLFGENEKAVSSSFRQGNLQAFSPVIMSLPSDAVNRRSDVISQIPLSQEMQTNETDLECCFLECPQTLRKVVTLCQHTVNDMTAWNIHVEEERDLLVDQFVQSCLDICSSLTICGFWADFIDPTAGKPYLGAHTNATLFETDPVMRHFGFTINDLGCCKVIAHHVWGSNAFVGVLFTDAPLDHPVIQKISQDMKIP